ncbi:MAG: hypothetical protein ABL929_03470 [Ferruginibacter sp.]|nr:hypothetical protein [Ferruginibacter sp.]
MSSLLKYPFLFFLLLFVSVSTKASMYRVDDATINDFNVPNFTNESIAICFWDKRIQVVEKKRPTAWLGFLRGGYGNAFGVVLESGSSFYSLLNNRLQLAFEKINNHAKIADVSPFDDELAAKKSLQNTGCKKLILIKLNDFKIDGYNTSYYFYSNIDISIMNANGEVLVTSNYVDKYELGKPQKYKKPLPEAIRKTIFNALNKTEITDAVNSGKNGSISTTNKFEEKTENKEVEKEENSNLNVLPYDIIVTKKGDEIQASVEEITDKTIKYKSKNQPNAPIRNINIVDVFMIKYKDGTKEIIK